VRIAIVNQPFDTVLANEEQRGSVAIVNWELGRELCKHHEVVQWAAAAGGQVARESFAGQGIRRIPFALRRMHKIVDLIQGRLGRGDPYMSHDLFYREYGMRVAQTMADERPDVVYISTISQYGAIFRQALPHTRIVLHVHGDELEYFDAAKTLSRLQAFDAVVTVSEFVSHALRKRFPQYRGSINTIRNGVDIQRFTPVEIAAQTARKQLLFVSRVSPDKGVHVLVRAFEQLVRERDDVDLHIVGKPGLLGLGFMRLHFDDPIVAELEDYYGRGLVNALRKEVLGQRNSYINSICRTLTPQARDRLVWRGTIPLEELVAAYSRASLFVLPSLWKETFGIPIVEAMACGVSVIASRCGGIPEIVLDGITGHLVERGDVDALARIMGAMLAAPDRAREMGHAGRQRVAAEFTWAHASARLEEVLLGISTPQQQAQS
jgi:glycosyltransferase involved in cell wall biosynthesis